MTGQIFADAQQAFGFARPALYRTHATVMEEKYPAFNYAMYIPTNEDGDMWDVGTIVTSLTGPAGKAEYLSGKGFDIPNTSAQMARGVSNFHLAGCGYELSLQEVNRASKMGVDINTRDASGARKIGEKFIYDRAMTGSTEKGFTGLLNNATVPTANVPADGTGAATTWATKNADQKARDINLALTDVYTSTKETELADTLLLPTSSFLDASTTRMGDTGMTVLAFLQQNNAYTAITGQPLNIMPARELETAGAGGTKRMVAYARNPGVLEFFLPGAFTFLPLHPLSSMSWRVDGIMNVGQTEIYRPKGVSYRDGILIMKKLTNYQLGPRGVNTKAGTVWIDPGQSVEIDADDIIGEVPDLGKKPGASTLDDSEVKALAAQVETLTKQVDALTGERDALAKDKTALTKANADLTKQVETLTKPKP